MKFEVGKEYKTRSGLKVVIYDLNYRDNYPIAGKVLYENGKWTLESWDKDGKYYFNTIENRESDYDLILPEPIILKDDFGTQLPDDIKSLPKAKKGFKLKYRKGGCANKEQPDFKGYLYDSSEKWQYDDRWEGTFSNRHYLELIPFKQYWSKPEDIPNNGNIWMRHMDYDNQYRKIDVIESKSIVIGAAWLSYSNNLQNYRWSLTPYGEGNECLIEN